MSNFEALFEDEDDVFGGTPRSKYWDIASQANDEIVKEEMDKVIEKYAAMELVLRKMHDNDDERIDRALSKYILENSMEVENHKKGLYIEFTGEIVCRLDS
ncbi:MAG: DUF2018 family protein [Campylobacterota bacterium]|nr:DUF2018 family protein [Campylobacterota bacterium]